MANKKPIKKDSVIQITVNKEFRRLLIFIITLLAISALAVFELISLYTWFGFLIGFIAGGWTYEK